MRTTLTIDDDLLATAREYSGLDETSAIVKLALKSYIAREATRRLISLGGSAPDFEAGPRKRFWGLQEGDDE